MKSSVWTLSVSTYEDRDPFVSVHENERECLLALRENFDPHEEGPYVPDDPALFEHYVQVVEDVLSLRKVVVDKHDVEVGVEFFVAHVDSRNFEFEGAGETEDEARAALRRALMRHKEQALYCAWVSGEINEMVREANIQSYLIGAAYRDGEVIR